MNMIQKMSVYNDGKTLFEDGSVYKVPVYQRAFAWGTPPHDVDGNEIVRLMEDIQGATDGDYYIGSIVVKERSPNEYEVIDGQQRLTALYIILNCLDIEIKLDVPPLTYDLRQRSTEALAKIREIVARARDLIDGRKSVKPQEAVNRDSKGNWSYLLKENELENSICNGIMCVCRKLGSGEFDAEALKQGLGHLLLYRVKVPENTDLNRYFEVMNTRGEQLSSQDIVKARIMWNLDEGKRNLFARVWNACSDMGDYVQMHFSDAERRRFFGENGDKYVGFDNIGDGDECPPKPSTNMSLVEAIMAENDDIRSDAEQTKDDEEDNSAFVGRFKSVIPFPQFLLNVIEVFRANPRGGPTKELDKRELDEKKLIERFEAIFRDGTKEQNAATACAFMECLLKCRFLFDKYIIKRDYVKDEVDGDWSLKRLCANKICPTDETESCEDVLMLQSCLRVSYTEMKNMHWITVLLNWLYSASAINMREFMGVIENVAKDAVKEQLKKLLEENCRMGTRTPHLLFNYLDFLLWRRMRHDDKSGAGDELPFEFAYRNSVEHWYPQHPSEFNTWESVDGQNRRDVDQFGNLCVVQPSENSKFSNLKPSAKQQQYGDIICNGSLKLRLMSRCTPANNEEIWKNEVCEEHGREMIKLLRDAVQLP